MEEEQPVCPSANGKNEKQEESTNIQATPAKKRSVDILSTTNSPQQVMSIEECVKEEPSCSLGYNHQF